MPTIALITPQAGKTSENLGHNFITAGIQYLLQSAYPDATFKYINMLDHDPEGFKILEHESNLVVVCGNPRFNASEQAEYWDSHLFFKLALLKKPGPYKMDAYAGSVAPLENRSIPELTQLLMSIKKNRTLLDTLRSFDKIIARDEVTLEMFNSSGINAAFLPDSSYFAPLFYGVKENLKVMNAVILFQNTNNKKHLETIIKIARKLESELPLSFITTNELDYAWIKVRGPAGLKVIKINDPLALLQTLASCDKVLSFRIHAAIPALALGCKVSYIAIDTRHLTLSPFLIPHVPASMLINPAITLLYGGSPPSHAQLQAEFTNVMGDIKL